MSIVIKDVFMNLPVKDLKKSKEFFSKLGFEFNMDYCNKEGCWHVPGEHTYVMLLTENFSIVLAKLE